MSIPFVVKLIPVYPAVFFSLLGWWWAMSSLLESGNAAAFVAVGYLVPFALFAFAAVTYRKERRNQPSKS